tara:strand:- start:137 stop:778 length:642 start_codon:yes stop_codon:yes gene_type:complete
MELANLSLTSIKLCSPVIVFIIYVIVSGISLFIARNTLKRFENQKMENLYNLHSWSEVKLVVVLGVMIYGLCQYDQMNLAWIFLILPVIYIMLKNLLVYYNVSIAHQNAPKKSEDFVRQVVRPPKSDDGVRVYPTPPTVKKEVNTNIFGIRGDPVIEGQQNSPSPGPVSPPPPSPPPPTVRSDKNDSMVAPSQTTPIDQTIQGADIGGWGAPF